MYDHQTVKERQKEVNQVHDGQALEVGVQDLGLELAPAQDQDGHEVAQEAQDANQGEDNIVGRVVVSVEKLFQGSGVPSRRVADSLVSAQRLEGTILKHIAKRLNDFQVLSYTHLIYWRLCDLTYLLLGLISSMHFIKQKLFLV